MPTTLKQMMEAANAVVPRITPAEARELIAKGDALVVDVRDAPEVEKTGKIAGALNVSRGMLVKDLGYERVYNLGAFKDWAEAGGPIEHPAPPASAAR